MGNCCTYELMCPVARGMNGIIIHGLQRAYSLLTLFKTSSHLSSHFSSNYCCNCVWSRFASLSVVDKIRAATPSTSSDELASNWRQYGWDTLLCKESGLVVGGLLAGRFSELSLVQLTRNMTEWSASNQRHWPVNLMLGPNYNINLQLSRTAIPKLFMLH